MSALTAAAAALLDLVLPVRCAGCGVAGSPACAGCLGALRGPGMSAMPDPVPVGLPPTFTTVVYDGAVRALLLAHKERGRLALARPLGTALATAVLAGVGGTGCGVVLVPVPTSASARRERGHDATLRLARAAATTLRASGVPASVLPMLRFARRVRDSVGLTSGQRAANLAGAFVAASPLVPRLAGRSVVVVDDVVTTGATLAEAAAALRVTGADVGAAATVAATVRRIPTGSRSGLHSRARRV